MTLAEFREITKDLDGDKKIVFDCDSWIYCVSKFTILTEIDKQLVIELDKDAIY